eukprot:jgi/Botrbrau1/3027/Bobra.0070s0023.1
MGLFNVIASAAVGAVSASALLLGLIRSGTIVIRSKHRRVVRTANPNPSYREGDKQPHPYGDSQRLLLNPSEMGADLYPFIISCVVPRPIAFISSLSKEGIGNLSPYSYFGVMSHDPPYVTIGTCHTRSRSEGMKDSEQSILETGEFTLNMISEWFIESANFTCGNYDRGCE